MPVGGKYTMGISEAAYAANLLRCKILIPMHYDTFPDQKADLNKLKDLLKDRAPSTDLIILEPCGTHII
jgi:L-ascorbate metabolism protein UlaG (beta-lactamase superfamily)